MTKPGSKPHRSFPAVVENGDAVGRVLLVCEHASRWIPEEWGTLGLDEAARQAHIAWDPGALGLARALAARLDATLVHAPVSRLVYDCNRPPEAPGAMPERSEIYDIPGNDGISAEERLARTRAVYLPFHAAVQTQIAARLARGPAPVMVTVHSFTPVYHGETRTVELGILHDSDDRLAQALLAEAGATGLRAELNAPYSATDGVTHSLRLQALPYGLLNVMLEVRNDLIASPEAETDVADRLAPALARAVGRLCGKGPAEPAGFETTGV